MIRKRYDELKPGDVFRLTDGKTYILVAEVRERANGTMVEISGFRRADPPANGQYNFSTRYLRDREVEVYNGSRVLQGRFGRREEAEARTPTIACMDRRWL